MRTKFVCALMLGILFLGMPRAFADDPSLPTCTPNPTQITLAPGGSAQVNYHCTVPNSLPGYNYTLVFNTDSAWTIQALQQFQHDPYQATVTAGQTPGTFYATIKYFSIGEGDSPLNQTPLTIIVSSPPAPKPNVVAGALSCNPETILVDGVSQCSINYTNNGTASATGVTVIIPAPSSGQVSTVQSSCGSTISESTTCTYHFSYTAPDHVPTPPQVSITVHYADAEKETVRDQNTTVTVEANPVPANLQVGDIQCFQDNGCNCNISFKDVSPTDDVTVQSVTPFISQGGGQVGVANAQCNAMGPSGECHITFPYTETTQPGIYTLGVTYGIKDDVSRYQKTTTVHVGIPVTLNTVTGSVLPDPATGALPNQYVLPNAALPITFNFLNQSGQTIYYNAAVQVVRDDGVTASIPASELSGSCLQGGVNRLLPMNGACTITVNFQPKDYKQFSVGDRISVRAQLLFGKKAMCGYVQGSNLTPWDVVIGDAPIYATVISNRFFIQDSSNTPFVGAFVFQNNTQAEITGVQPVQASLPAGFASAMCATFSDARFKLLPVCTNTLLPTQKCGACFQASNPENISSDVTVSAHLRYDQSSAFARRTFVAIPQYRNITVSNQCSSSVWAAFVSGAAYHYCHHDYDCPAGMQCDTGASQCKVPATTPIDSNGACPAGSYLAPNGLCSKGCNAVSDACPNFSTCNSANGLCYWDLPTYASGDPDAKNMKVNAGKSAVFQVANAPKNNGGVVWSGGLVGRTGCTLDEKGVLHCATGDCPNVNPDGSCPNGVGPKPPATQAEFTLQFNAQDYYDVEIIDGFNIPVSMSPDNGVSNNQNAYICRSAGAPITTMINGKSTSNVCPWTFQMISPTQDQHTLPATARYMMLHYYVTDGGKLCQQQSDCGSGDVCGISQNNVNPAGKTPETSCGKLLGFWSTSKLCSFNAAAYDQDLQCNTIGDGLPKTAWLGCNSGVAQNSCYDPLHATLGECCGCPYWSASSGNSKQLPETLSYLSGLYADNKLNVLFPNGDNNFCKAYTPFWVNSVLLPDLIWMKQGCSSVYTFAYDDATSTFTCHSATDKENDKVNQQNYTVTFCPGGNSGTVNGNPIYFPAAN